MFLTSVAYVVAIVFLYCFSVETNDEYAFRRIYVLGENSYLLSNNENETGSSFPCSSCIEVKSISANLVMRKFCMENYELRQVQQVLLLFQERECAAFLSISSNDLRKGSSFVSSVKYFSIVPSSSERISLWIKDSAVCTFVHKAEILEEFA